MLPMTVTCRSCTLSHYIKVAKALTVLLYKPINHFSEPHNFHTIAQCNTKPSTGCCFPINSGITRNEIYPFRFGSSLVSSSLNFSTMGGSSSEGQTNVHDFTVKDIRGNDVDLTIYKGKALLIVNVASECGLTTSNYKEMNELYAKYKQQGLEILAFPCNQFAGQEPGDNEQIVEVACTRFKAEFPIFDKVEVNGDNAAPIYKFLKSSKGGLLGDNIKWNFEKFLVDKDGNVVDRYAPTTSPLNIEKDIKKILGIA
ncbi:probable phospholipid hydroperoxide glutathione peroxidase [Cryptomeria japonica]|uniref:probable phospholipid hydroperoxide glutathione peroxidase n=1 Tax=Cryptomeria japonica TaxID=3369 RepID=UPI0027DA2B1E|nr:probable phospholipid hydroperoxide glutathione peroxidase [Cryptomeria japonica]